MAEIKSKVNKVVNELPYNAEAEKVVLGSAMLKSSYCLDVLSSLNEEDFFIGKHQLIFRAVATLADPSNKKLVDVLSVAQELQNFKELENIGGASYLAECTQTVVAKSALSHYIRIVQDNSVLRNMLKCIRKIDSDYKSQEIEDINTFVLQSETNFKESVEKRHISSFVLTKDIAGKIKENLEVLQNDERDSDVIGVSTGYERLNKITQGFKPGEMIIVAARPSVGKTTLCLNFAHKMAVKSKKAIAFFSLEMSKEQLFNRLVAISSTVNAKDINSGRIRTANDHAKVMQGIKEIENAKIYIDDTPSGKLNDIIAKSTKLAAHEPDLACIFIDYLGLVQVPTKSKSGDNRQEEVRKISLALKALARDLNIPIVVVSQLSRAVEQRDSKRPMMSDLRDSGNIEQDADIVMLLYRGDYYDSAKKNGTYDVGNKKGGQLTDRDKYELTKQQKEQELGKHMPGNTSYTEVIVAKNRSGQTGTAPMFFYKDCCKFDQPTAEWEAAMREIANSED